MTSLSRLTLLLLLASSAYGGGLPGFRTEHLASTSGFATSIAIDSRGTIYYTTLDGGLFRLSGSESTHLVQFPTVGNGNSGLLGMALIDDGNAVVHYTTPSQTHDVLARISLTTGEQTVIRAFVCDITQPGRESSSEHHGGNPTVAPDGSIFFGIGDFGRFAIAAQPEWNAGKIFRVLPDGQVIQFALGLRNPYDMAWDTASGQLVVPDNGPDNDIDEIHLVSQGDNLGWPNTWGHRPPVPGARAPEYVFPFTVAPTGIVALSGRGRVLRRGFLMGAFVTNAIYYFPDLTRRPVPDPIPLLEDLSGFVIDVAEGPNGEIWILMADSIHRLVLPARGDCDGNGRLDDNDLRALRLELHDGSPHATIYAQNGMHSGSWGCDANGDSVIDSADQLALMKILHPRQRSVGRR